MLAAGSLESAISALLLCVVFVEPLLVSPWGFDHAILAKESLLLLISGSLVILYFLRAATERTFLFTGTLLRKPILLLLILASLSIAKAVNLSAAAYRLALLSAGAILFFAAMHARLTRKRIEALGGAAVVSALIATLYAFLQSAGVDPLLPPTTVGLVSTLGNPNFLAEYLMYAIPICLGLALGCERPGWRLLYGAACLMLLVGLLLCKTKAATLGLLVSLGLFGLLLRRQPAIERRVAMRRILPLGAVGLATAGVFAFLFLSPFAGSGGMRGALERYFTSQAIYLEWRMVFYSDSLRMVLDNPLLGVGIGNFESTYPLYRSMPETLDPRESVLDHAHNDFLEMSAEVGVGGLIALLWLLWGFFRAVFTLPVPSLLGVGYAASVGALAVNSLFAFGLYNPVPLTVFWLSMALAIRLLSGATLEAERGVAAISEPRPPSWAILAASAAVCLLLYASLRPLVADAYLSQGQRLFRRGWAKPAVPSLERAARLAPARLEPQFYLAEAYASTGRYHEAVAVLERYLRHDPYNFRTLYHLGLRSEQAGDEAGAVKAYERARDIQPLYSLPLLRLGMIRERRGDRQGAVDAYRKALSLNPGLAEAANNLAILLSSQGNLEEAIQVWVRAAKTSPEDPVIARNLAAAYLRKGEDQAARSWAVRAGQLERKERGR